MVWSPEIKGEKIMSSLIIIQGNSLESYYDQTMDYIYTQYHSHAPYSPDVHLDDHLVSEMGYYERMAQDTADQENYDQGVPLGKLVI
jgi:hypothetical protein